MTQVRYITDEELVAFLDGELPEQDMAAITDALSQDTLLQERLGALDVPMKAMRDGADAMLSAAPAFPDTLIAKKPNDRMRLAGMIAVLGIGLGVAATVWPSGQPSWIAAVANYQSLYVAQTLDRSEPIDQREANLLALSDDIGLDISPLSDIDDIDYRRAQLLGFDGQPLVQIAYLDNQVPIAICITFVDGPDQSESEGTHFGLSTVSWQKDGRGFLVIGGNDTDLLRKIAGQVQDAT